MRVVEKFVSINGEGQRAGEPAAFVRFQGCNLCCSWCDTKWANEPDCPYEEMSPAEVAAWADETGITNVTLTGGEPLLQSPFLRAFIDYVREAGKTWRFAVETSLAVPEENLALLLPGPGEEPFVREWIVDVKDMNPDLYEAYTAKSPALLRHNLEILAARCPDTVTLRLPRIPGFNTDADRDRSEKELRAMGFKNFDRFDYILPEKP